jgi:hypothetical protein
MDGAGEPWREQSGQGGFPLELGPEEGVGGQRERQSKAHGGIKA